MRRSGVEVGDIGEERFRHGPARGPLARLVVGVACEAGLDPSRRARFDRLRRVEDGFDRRGPGCGTRPRVGRRHRRRGRGPSLVELDRRRAAAAFAGHGRDLRLPAGRRPLSLDRAWRTRRRRGFDGRVDRRNRGDELRLDLGDLALQVAAPLVGDVGRYAGIAVQRALERGEGRPIHLLTEGAIVCIALFQGAANGLFDHIQTRIPVKYCLSA
jgi:hypothetical protein